MRAALPAWVAARVLLAVAWFASLLWIDRFRDGVRPEASLQGLLAWDGAFYRGLAEVGYVQVGREGVRFFPLFPLVGRALGAVVASPGFWLVVVANVAALAAGALVHRLCLVEGLGAPVATRAAALTALLPPAFVLAWGYSEALLLVLSLGAFLALRDERWWTAAVLGLLAGLTRPTGALLALPALVEAARGWRSHRAADLPGRAAAVAAPAAGALAFLWWVDVTFGDWHLPLDVQDELRGGMVNPFVRVMEAGVDLARLDVHGLHFPFAVAMVALCVVVARRLPASYSLYSGAVVAVALAAENLNSIERYGLSAFPIVMALALVVRRRPVANAVVGVSSAGLVGLATLAWLQEYVP